jgi:hypothetical protein
MAKFEVCGHFFADLSERGYGVGLLNDSKYGYTAIDNVLSLSLLRSFSYISCTSSTSLSLSFSLHLSLSLSQSFFAYFVSSLSSQISKEA